MYPGAGLAILCFLQNIEGSAEFGYGLKGLLRFIGVSTNLEVEYIIYVAIVTSFILQWLHAIYLGRNIFRSRSIYSKMTKKNFDLFSLYFFMFLFPFLISLFSVDIYEGYSAFKIKRYIFYTLPLMILGYWISCRNKKFIKQFLVTIVTIGIPIGFTEVLAERSYLLWYADKARLNYSTVIGTVVLICVSLFIYSLNLKRYKLSFIALVLVSLSYISILLSASRGQIIFTTLLVPTLVLIYYKTYCKTHDRGYAWKVKFIIGILGILTLLLLSFELFNRYFPLHATHTFGRFHVMQEGIQDRYICFSTAWNLISRSPIVGYGFGEYGGPHVVTKDYPENFLLEIWVEMGFSGLLCILIALGIVIYKIKYTVSKARLTDYDLFLFMCILGLFLYFLLLSLKQSDINSMTRLWAFFGSIILGWPKT